MILFLLFIHGFVHADAFLAESVRARAVIDAVDRAEGDADARRNVRQIQIEYEGELDDPLQSLAPDRPPNSQPIRVTAVLDPKGERVYQSIDAGIAGVVSVPAVSIYKNGTLYSLDTYRKWYTARSGPPDGAVNVTLRYRPPLVVDRLVRSRSSATYLGTTVVAGHKADQIEFSWNESTRYRASFDSRDHHLRELRLLAPDAFQGEDEVVVRYEGDAAIGPFWTAGCVTAYRRGSKYIRLCRKRATATNEAADTPFDIPPAYSQAPSSTLRTEMIAPGTYEVSGLGDGFYRNQFIDTGDSVVVFDAVLGAATAQRVVAEIKRTLPGKPIKFVVISHFHSDHASGIGPYVAEGATIVTTRRNEAILTKYARGARPKFLEVSSARTLLPKGGGSLEVYQVPNSGHVEEMLVLYDPRTATIFDADLFAEFFPFSPAYRQYARWLQSPSAPRVTSMAGVHHGFIQAQHFFEMANAI
jgi:hypothetical protein